MGYKKGVGIHGICALFRLFWYHSVWKLWQPTVEGKVHDNTVQHDGILYSLMRIYWSVLLSLCIICHQWNVELDRKQYLYVF